MSDIENFNFLVERAMNDNKLAHMRPVVAKELLHYDILFSLEKDGLLDDLTFQDGTSLRLCYGAPRFSEDLDFVGGRNFSSAKVQGIKKCIEKYIGERYGLEITVKEPREMAVEADYADIKVDNYPEKLNDIINRLDTIVRGREFMDEMSRFIPIDVQERTLKKDKFREFLVNEVKKLLLNVAQSLKGTL